MRLASALVLTLLLLATVPVRATVIEALSMRELVAESDLIAEVAVLSQTARWDELDRIVTDVTLRVDEPLWATDASTGSGSEVVVTRLGGELDGLGLRVEGEPTFVTGERVLLFAHELRGELRAVGMSQGVLPIEIRAGAEPMVLPGGAGLALVAPGTAARVAARPALPAPLPLTEVLDEVRTLITEVHGAR
jgi:hypothetical protein